jgi:hypothetical protein
MGLSGPFHSPGTHLIGGWVETRAGVDTFPRFSSPLPSNYTDYYIPALLDGHSLRILLTSTLVINCMDLLKEIVHKILKTCTLE